MIPDKKQSGSVAKILEWASYGLFSIKTMFIVYLMTKSNKIEKFIFCVIILLMPSSLCSYSTGRRIALLEHIIMINANQSMLLLHE